MKYLIGALSALIILFVICFIFIYSGFYNMSAMSPHGKTALWMIETLKENSIKHYADNDVKAPVPQDTLSFRKGFIHYREMCAGCHGAPGIEQLAKGFYPNPPLLSKTVKNWNSKELFWIIKNGLKMSGMPAFGVTHSDDMIWHMVAFTEKLDTLTKEQYQILDKEIKNQMAE